MSTKTFTAPVTKQVKMTADYDSATGVLTVRRAKTGKAIVVLNREKIDSGALAGHVDEGHVVVPASENERNRDRTSMVSRLIRAGVIELVGKPWGTWGGDAYQAARVLI